MSAEPAPQNESDELPRMSFGDHLDELRKRLFIALLSVVVSAMVLAPFKTEITSIYVKPYRTMWNQAFSDHCERLEQKAKDAGGLEQLHWTEKEALEFCRRAKTEILAGTFPNTTKIAAVGSFPMPFALKATGGLEDFWTFMAATFLFALVVSSPVVLWQMWAFVSAGLYQVERGAVMRYFPFAVLLLCSGVAFGYLLAVPYGLFFLVKMMDWFQIEPMFTVRLYFGFLLTLTTALGFLFQLPLFMLAVVKVGLVTHATLKKNWRLFVLGFFLTSAVLTPPDPFTQVMVAGPMVLLFVVGLFLTSRVEGAVIGGGSAGKVGPA